MSWLLGGLRMGWSMVWHTYLFLFYGSAWGIRGGEYFVEFLFVYIRNLTWSERRSVIYFECPALERLYNHSVSIKDREGTYDCLYAEEVPYDAFLYRVCHFVWGVMLCWHDRLTRRYRQDRYCILSKKLLQTLYIANVDHERCTRVRVW